MPKRTATDTVSLVRAKSELRLALRDLLAFYDRIQNSDDHGWSADDAKRLAEIRSLVAVYFGRGQ